MENHGPESVQLLAKQPQPFAHTITGPFSAGHAVYQVLPIFLVTQSSDEDLFPGPRGADSP